MNVAIVGEKGGGGKTTFATNLAGIQGEQGRQTDKSLCWTRTGKAVRSSGTKNVSVMATGFPRLKYWAPTVRATSE